MIDRGIIKWQPFDSCFSSQTILKDIVKEKKKINLPNLSEDQINIITEKIIDAFNLKLMINLEYFEEGIIKWENGKITNINKFEKKIYLNHKYISFTQILTLNY